LEGSHHFFLHVDAEPLQLLPFTIDPADASLGSTYVATSKRQQEHNHRGTMAMVQLQSSNAQRHVVIVFLTTANGPS